MSTKVALEQLAENMRRWQKLENATVAQTAKIMSETDHPLIRLVMEGIQRDSAMHYRIQQLIIDSLEKAPVQMLTDQLEKIWDSVEAHLKMERKTIELAETSLKAIEGTKNVVQIYLLNFLLEDEKKHENLLTNLELIKKKMYP